VWPICVGIDSQICCDTAKGIVMMIIINLSKNGINIAIVLFVGDASGRFGAVIKVSATVSSVVTCPLMLSDFVSVCLAVCQ